MIGLIKRIPSFNLHPPKPDKLINSHEYYILCDSEFNIRNITYGVTLDFGYFPKIFNGNSKNSIFSKNIHISALSNDLFD